MADVLNGRLKRRELLAGAVTGAGLLALGEAWHCGPEAVRWGLRLAAGAEPAPEVTKVRLPSIQSICIAPQHLAGEFLPREGFREVEYVPFVAGADHLRALASGQVDFAVFYSASLMTLVDRGDPVVLLGGVHVGCFELFGTQRIRRISDLKGKTVAVRSFGDADHLFLSSMLAYVGVDPRTVNWVVHRPAEADALLAAGKIDALMAFPPRGLDLRWKKIGHVVVDSAIDRPWSQYFCCYVGANRKFVARYPIATKRALRAILNATDAVVHDPEHAARFLVEKGYTPRYDHAVEALRHLPFGHWRDVEPEDTLRFYALRLHEVGMIKNTPQRIISQGTDWRFLNELRRDARKRSEPPGVHHHRG
jgi:NitT/TauT family transport system substrate-binding protein